MNDINISNGMYGLPEHSFRLDGKTVVVTGASRNIGLSLALGFGQAGADVVMVARGEDRLTAAVAAVRKALPGRTILQFAADVSSPSDVQRLALFVADKAGAADVLVNNARANGKERSAPENILDIEDGSWQDTFETNLLGPYRLISALFRDSFKQGRPGCIINVVSGSGFQPVPTASSCSYGASKAGLWMMTRYLAMHLAPVIRVNAVCPGNVTPDGEVRSELARMLLPAIPMGRIGKPRELAGAAVYLASEAASYTTGEVIFCNGGRAW